MRDDLIGRIECGMSNERDARVVSMIVARLARYEVALRTIEMWCSGQAQCLAREALKGVEQARGGGHSKGV